MRDEMRGVVTMRKRRKRESCDPMRPLLSRVYVMEELEARLADNPPDAWLLVIERDLLAAIGRQGPRQGWGEAVKGKAMVDA